METLILRCLNKNPDSRFASASALKQALESARARPLQRQAQRNLLAKLVKPAACLAIVLAVLAGIQLARKGVEPQLTQKLLKHPTAFEYSRNDSPDPSPNLPRSLQQLSDWLSNEKNKGADKIIIIRAQIYQGQVRNRLGLAQIPADFMDEFTLQKQSGMFLRLKQFGACLKFKHHFAPLHLLSAKSAFEGEKAAEKDIESLESVNNETSDPFESKTIINNVKESKASACLRLSEIESWRGDLANAEKHARRAYEVLAPESSSKSDALLRLALVQYMKGELAQCRKTILKEMDFESSALKSGSSVSLGDESLALMNEIGLAPSVSKFMLEFFPDPYPELRANHQNKILRMQLELARSLLLQKKYQDCFETLDALLDYCNSTMSAEETGDRAEGLYLRALHLCKRDSEIGVHLRRYFEQLKRSTVETRQLEALPLLIRDLTKIGFSLNLLSELIEADLHKQEEKETVPTICIDARLAQGETALFRKDFTNALRYFQQAEKNCQARDTQQCRYLRALALARQMETKIAVREYDKVLDLHALFLKLNEKGSGKNEMAEPLFFYGRHLNLKAKYLLNAALSDSNTQVKRLNKMVTEHRKQGISILDDYAACARDCAQIEVKENRQAEALTTLSAAIDNLENYQGWKQTERAALLELMCRILNQSLTNLESTKPALNLETKRAEIKNELEKCKLRLAKLEIPDRTQSLINDGPLKTLPWLCPASI